jgi:CheY-like chemotaxis protein
MSNRPIHILLIEDDRIDTEAIIRSLKESSTSWSITIVEDGAAALSILRGQAGQPALSYPYLILLDLYLPGMDGYQFLQHLRQDPHLSCSVVFALTNSHAPADIARAYDYHIAGYIPKPEPGHEYAHLRQLLDVYCQIVQFAPQPFLV